ncbi:hypothetical protein T439DRAFT_359769 [Meredithblackwellia eburnea MCA 4105]
MGLDDRVVIATLSARFLPSAHLSLFNLLLYFWANQDLGLACGKLVFPSRSGERGHSTSRHQGTTVTPSLSSHWYPSTLVLSFDSNNFVLSMQFPLPEDNSANSLQLQLISCNNLPSFDLSFRLALGIISLFSASLAIISTLTVLDYDLEEEVSRRRRRWAWPKWRGMLRMILPLALLSWGAALVFDVIARVKLSDFLRKGELVPSEKTVVVGLDRAAAILGAFSVLAVSSYIVLRSLQLAFPFSFLRRRPYRHSLVPSASLLLALCILVPLAILNALAGILSSVVIQYADSTNSDSSKGIQAILISASSVTSYDHLVQLQLGASLAVAGVRIATGVWAAWGLSRPASLSPSLLVKPPPSKLPSLPVTSISRRFPPPPAPSSRRTSPSVPGIEHLANIAGITGALLSTIRLVMVIQPLTVDMLVMRRIVLASEWVAYGIEWYLRQQGDQVFAGERRGSRTEQLKPREKIRNARKLASRAPGQFIVSPPSMPKPLLKAPPFTRFPSSPSPSQLQAYEKFRPHHPSPPPSVFVPDRTRRPPRAVLRPSLTISVPSIRRASEESLPMIYQAEPGNITPLYSPSYPVSISISSMKALRAKRRHRAACTEGDDPGVASSLSSQTGLISPILALSLTDKRRDTIDSLGSMTALSFPTPPAREPAIEPSSTSTWKPTTTSVREVQRQHSEEQLAPTFGGTGIGARWRASMLPCKNTKGGERTPISTGGSSYHGPSPDSPEFSPTSAFNSEGLSNYGLSPMRTPFSAVISDDLQRKVTMKSVRTMDRDGGYSPVMTG